MNGTKLSLALASLALMSIGSVSAQVVATDVGCGTTVLAAPTVLSYPAVVGGTAVPVVPTVLAYPRRYTGREYWYFNDRCWGAALIGARRGWFGWM